jgi:hypothetical protein
MTHKPPVPEAATPPWPATPPPRAANEDAASESGTAAARQDESDRIGGVDKRIVAGVAGIAVGSAAIAAALMFAGRLNRPKSACAPLPPRPTSESAPASTHVTHGDASDITVD